MLDPCEAIRKNSFGARPENGRDPRRAAEPLEVLPVGSGQERERHGQRERRVAKKGAPDRPPEAPAGVSGDDLEDLGGRPRPGGRLHDVRLGSETIVQQGPDDPRVGIQAQGREGAPADRAGQVDPFGERHFGQAAQEVPVRRPAHLRVNAGVGRKVGQIAPKKRRDQGEGRRSGRPRVARQHQAYGVVAASRPIVEDRLELLPRKIRPAKEL